MTTHFEAHLAATDPLIAGALMREKERQQSQIELIASENIMSRAVLDALGHSGSQANLAVFFALVKPGDRVLSLDLAAGGHLSHGLGANLSGRWFDAHHYGVERETGLIDYDKVAKLAAELRPALLIAGGSAYPRQFDFERMAAIARKVGAYFLVDMAHFAGLVAGGVHPSPLPHADIVTCTTTKTLRGPRGGVILSNNPDWQRKLQAAVFPGVQGSIHTQVIGAKAVCFGEALTANFRTYAAQVKANAATLSATLAGRGMDIVSGGTDTHIVLLNLSTQGLSGAAAEAILDEADITSNKNPVPFDSSKPAEWVGLRLGSGAATTRGLGEAEFAELGQMIADLILASATDERDVTVASARERCAALCSRFPIY
jgi:glycine hydroxymethyltransferase